ncbi:MAG: DNA mismatch repair protein MutS, partial [Clostridia bacterium]|nr:DNA mismatch repair protein MutS [Clostridia bacterium]
HFSVATLSGYGCEDMPAAISAAGALMRYLEETQKNALSHIHAIKTIRRSAYMLLDASTRRNLELTQPLQFGGSRKNTLLYLIDRTRSGMGGRMLRDWVDRPLQSPADIEARLDAVDKLAGDMLCRGRLQELLKGMYDIERLSSKIVYGALNARDCLALRQSLERIPGLAALLAGSESVLIRETCAMLDPMEDVRSLLAAAIADEPPVSVKEGGFIRRGYHTEVDELSEITEGT